MPTRVKDIGASPYRIWRGYPDCEAMHSFILEELQRIGCAFLTSHNSLSEIQIGNLGEFVTYCIGRKMAYASCRCRPANAYEPLNTISKGGIDLVWFRFANNPDNDIALLQEVKTTGDPGMTVHYALVRDYQRMFGRSSRQTLSIMLQAIKSRLVMEEKRPDLALRITRMIGASPQTCEGITLLPTILHEKEESDPTPTMLTMRTSIATFGWPEEVIKPWSIAMSGLIERLHKLGQGL